MELPIARIKDGRADFSFSGVKTAVLLHVRREGIPPVSDPSDVPPRVRDLVASFQKAVVTALVRGLVKAAREHRPRSLVLTGGVAANSLLRREAERAARELGLPIFIPPLSLTTDNAAMIAAAGSGASWPSAGAHGATCPSTPSPTCPSARREGVRLESCRTIQDLTPRL